MKKLLAAFAALGVMVLAGCGQQKTAQSRFIYSGWSLYELKEDGKMQAAGKTDCGDEAAVYLKGSSAEKKNAVLVLSNNEEKAMDFVRVNYNGKDYWTRECFIAGLVTSYPAYVLTEVHTYSKPESVAIRTGKNNKIAAMTPVVIVDDSEAAGFYHIKQFNWEASGADIYIEAGENIVADEDGFEIIKTLNRINKDTKQAVVDDILLALYDTAYLNRGGAFYQFVKNKVNTSNASPMVKLTFETYSFNGEER